MVGTATKYEGGGGGTFGVSSRRDRRNDAKVGAAVACPLWFLRVAREPNTSPRLGNQRVPRTSRGAFEPTVVLVRAIFVERFAQWVCLGTSSSSSRSVVVANARFVAGSGVRPLRAVANELGASCSD